MQFWHAIRGRSLESNNNDDISIQFTGLERGFDRLLAVKHARGRFGDMPLGLHRGNLDHTAAEWSVEHLQTASAGKRVLNRAHDIEVAALARRLAPLQLITVQPRLLAIRADRTRNAHRVAL